MDYANDDCLDARGEVWTEHDSLTVYEDDQVWQGECRRCGAEGFEDKTKD